MDDFDERAASITHKLLLYLFLIPQYTKWYIYSTSALGLFRYTQMKPDGTYTLEKDHIGFFINEYF